MLKQAFRAIPTSILKNQNTSIEAANEILSSARNCVNIPPSGGILYNRPITGPVFGMPATNVEDSETKSPEGPAIANSLDDEQFELGAINDLVESYEVARKDLSNKWLSFMKSCHVYLYRGGGEPGNSMAAFDLDGTIIKPKSNKRIPRNATDWQFFSVWTKVKVQQAVREHSSRLVMFTNQNGVGLRLVALEEVQERIELVTQRLNIPCTVFVATERDEFRKPKTGMFKLFEKAFNDEKPIDFERSFYCGDAIGYPSHSDADIKFAQTLGLPFLTPEKFLRGVKPKLVDQPREPVGQSESTFVNL